MLFKHLSEKQNDRTEAMKYAGAFFGMVSQALLTDVIMGLSRLYENSSRKSYGNLYNYLNFVSSNRSIFTVENKIIRIKNIGGLEYYIRENFESDIELIIKEQGKQLQKMESKINNLMVWRDKHYAHNDSKYFLSPEKLANDAPLLFKDIQDLVVCASQIVNKHTAQFNGQTTMISYSNVFDVDVILDIINDYDKNLKNQL